MLPTTRQVELIGKKEFTVATLKPEHKTFIVHVVALSVNLDDKIYLSKKAPIAHLKANKALVKVSSKYANFVNIFSLKLAVELLEYTGINNHAIKLDNN